MNRKFITIILAMLLSWLLLGVIDLSLIDASAASRVSQTLHYKVNGSEKQLKSKFPKIEFSFSNEVHGWYKYLLFEVLTALPEKHVNNLESIFIQRMNLDRRGVISFKINVQTRDPRVKLRLNPIEFPLEIGFQCQTGLECMRATSPHMNREFVAVAVHEIGHAIDFGKSTRGNRKSGTSEAFKDGPFLFFDDDPSVTSFYPICFNSAKRLSRKKCNRNDFVSIYAKTDVFEDFAETMTVYVLDGNNFYKKAIKNQKNGFDALMNKYNFFKEEIFNGKEFRLYRKNRNLFTTNDATLRNFPLLAFLYKY